MKWGMPTLVEFDSIEENLKLCRNLGLDFVELNMNLPMFQPDMLERLPVRDDVFYTIHLDENFCPADFNPLISEAWMETMRRTLSAAKRIGAPVINMHMSKGVYFTLPDRKLFLFEQYRDTYLRRIAALRDLCETELAGSDMLVCIENTGGYLDYQREAINLLIESPAFALTWDIGHWYKGKMDDGPFLMECREKLKHFHVHDAGIGGDHLPLGEGDVDILRMLTLAKAQEARCVLETKTAAALKTSVEWLKSRGWM